MFHTKSNQCQKVETLKGEFFQNNVLAGADVSNLGDQESSCTVEKLV